MKTFIATLAGVVIGGVLLWAAYQQYYAGICRSDARERMKTLGYDSNEYRSAEEIQACGIAGIE
jgi:hypothetical protein